MSAVIASPEQTSTQQRPAIPVFVVEDSRNMQSALADLFSVVGGFKIIGSAVNEMEATEWLEAHPGEWQLVTLDLILHDGSGFNLIQRFRQQTHIGKIVVFSDYVTPVIEERCSEMGADAVFGKTDIREFSAYLDELVSR
jgi:two-component system OmpR family response regulator